MDMKTFGDDGSAYDYAKSIKADFEGQHAASADSPARLLDRPAALSTKAERTINAGPDASIVVNRPLTREQRKALKDIGKVIAHLLKR